jgi:hypothetical protein
VRRGPCTFHWDFISFKIEGRGKDIPLDRWGGIYLHINIIHPKSNI